MRTLFRIVLFCFAVASIVTLCCIACKAQNPSSSPTYTGAMNDKVFIPAVVSGKMYKISSVKFGDIIVNNQDTMSNQAATMVQSGVGVLVPLVLKNGQGFLTVTNNTGSAQGVGINVAISYSDTATHLPIPVISSYSSSDDITVNHVVNLVPHFYGFSFILKANIPDGESVTLSYNVNGF